MFFDQGDWRQRQISTFMVIRVIFWGSSTCRKLFIFMMRKKLEFCYLWKCYVTSWSKTTIKGHQEKFPEIIDSFKTSSLKSGCFGPLNVGLDMPVVYQLWDMVKEVIYSTNIYMKILLKIFCIKKGNGLLPLVFEMNSLKDIHTLVVDFLKTPPKYPCDHPTNNINSDTYNNSY